jgi:nucleotide-binding universal stress UspA family protein
MNKSVVVGVDTSKESSLAAQVGWNIATAAGVECHFVHAMRDQWAAVRDLATATVGGSPHDLPLPPIATPQEFERAGMRITKNHPPFVAERMAVAEGRPSSVLRDACDGHDAGLLVVGGKHHTALGRLAIGSTAHELFHDTRVPLLVSIGEDPVIHRLLVAVDLSETSAAVLAVAIDIAVAVGAEVRSIHAAPARPSGVEHAYGLSDQELSQAAEKLVREQVWQTAGLDESQCVVRTDTPYKAITTEAKAWNADIIVVGSHGHVWNGRALLGRTTARLLNHLPTSVLMVPVAPPPNVSTDHRD